MSQIWSRSRVVSDRCGNSVCHFSAPLVGSTAATPVPTLTPLHPPDIWMNPVTGLIDTSAPSSVRPPNAFIPLNCHWDDMPAEGGLSRESVPLKFQKLESSASNARPPRSSPRSEEHT